MSEHKNAIKLLLSDLALIFGTVFQAEVRQFDVVSVESPAFDYSIRKINEVMLQECGIENIIDLYGAEFRNEDFYDSVHTTPQGSRRTGKLIDDAILSSGLRNYLD